MESDTDNPTPGASSGTEGASKPDAKLASALGGAEPPRPDVSASTVTRMMGIATVTELKLLEGRIDLLTAKITAVMAKVDKIASSLNTLPSGSDMDRLDIQIGSVKSVMKEILEAVQPEGSGKKSGSKDGAQEQSRRMREGIRTNADE